MPGRKAGEMMASVTARNTGHANRHAWIALKGYLGRGQVWQRFTVSGCMGLWGAEIRSLAIHNRIAFTFASGLKPFPTAVALNGINIRTPTAPKKERQPGPTIQKAKAGSGHAAKDLAGARTRSRLIYSSSYADSCAVFSCACVWRSCDACVFFRRACSFLLN